MKLFTPIEKMDCIEPRRATFYKSYSGGQDPLYVYIEEKLENSKESKTHEGFITYEESKVISIYSFIKVLFHLFLN